MIGRMCVFFVDRVSFKIDIDTESIEPALCEKVEDGVGTRESHGQHQWLPWNQTSRYGSGVGVCGSFDLLGVEEKLQAAGRKIHVGHFIAVVACTLSVFSAARNKDELTLWLGNTMDTTSDVAALDFITSTACCSTAVRGQECWCHGACA